MVKTSKYWNIRFLLIKKTNMTHNYWMKFCNSDHSGGRQCSCRAIVARKTTGEERGHLHSWPFSQALALVLCYWVPLGTGLG